MSFPGPVSGRTPVDEGSPDSGTGTDGYRRLNRKSLLSIYFGHAVSYAILLGAFILLETYAERFLGPNYVLVRYAFIAVLAVVLVYMAVAPPVFYARYRYRITADRIDVRSGVLVLRHILVPIERVHQVEVSRGPVNSALGLAEVTITTAGGVATLSYLELEEAERVAELLNSLVGRMLKGRVPATEPAGD
ncbi:PH domain-containing protein [Methanoculleus sp. Wushi-C6]|uniref:PH domain-containing protein n=1 Tax=Methanoculleus caldifontis TaxID=2651577 RepID=A0ABU3X1M0_9EURY|nr:PH domain-containing protein [Methanoculleus sp. Wushi-C6]MDV2481953.1 PH domain-containing protein [Methanoculleus sp. Wushi-C6]